MEYNIEGTYKIDGMIEGPIPKMPKAKERIESWVDFAKTRGLDFDLEFQSDAFVLVAKSKTRETKALGKEPADHVEETLDKLLKIIPKEKRNHFLSTVRFLEYTPQKEKQAVFAINPKGEFDILERELDVETMPPLIPLSKKERIKVYLIAAVVFLTVLFISSFFVNYKELVMGLFGHEKRFKSSTLTVETGVFKPFFTITKAQSADKGRSVNLKIKRTALFPSNSSKLNALLSVGDKNKTDKITPLLNRMAIENLVRGYLRVEFYSDRGEFIGSGEVRIVPLFKNNTTSIKVIFPSGYMTARLRFAL